LKRKSEAGWVRKSRIVKEVKAKEAENPKKLWFQALLFKVVDFIPADAVRSN